MQVKIKIKTAPGHAVSTQKQIEPFILGVKKIKNEVYANDDDDTIIWIVEGPPKRIIKITRNVARFDVVMASILKKRVVRKLAKLSDEDRKKLDDMLKNQTKIEILKHDDMVDVDNRTIWQKIKDKF